MFDKTKDLYKLQKQARQIKKQLKNTHIEAEDGGVVVTLNGEQEVISIKISDKAMQDKKKLENSIEKSFNKAVKKSQQIGAELMKDVMPETGGLPGMGG
ncbi:YbaB/EbfC family nucleoid-associated protein [Candidatus Peregrinibacteria bacterium]|nr:YbaB/EbfC family nucleoid-associated protein [Candidatus Peregrinibacteria bacterium]